MQWCYWQCCLHHLMLTPVPLVSCDADTGTNDITWPKGNVVPHQLSWPRECNGAIYYTVAITWQWCHCCHMMLTLAPMVSHDEKDQISSHSNCPDIRNTMVPLMILSASCDANFTTSGVTWHQHRCQWHPVMSIPAAMLSHDQKTSCCS